MKGHAGAVRVPASRRAFDFAFLLLLAPLVALPLAIVALAVFLDSPGPVLFRSRRLGFAGVPFDMVKFRTMKVDSAGHAVAGADDRRITPVGSFLRTTRLDELPQLWNVLRGEMSLVGPRPELQEFVDLHAEDYEQILSVPPGVTGPTQLRYSGVEPHLLSRHDDPERFYRDSLLPDKVKLDLEYARSRTLAIDLVVLIRTLALPFHYLRRRDDGEGRAAGGRLSAIAGATAVIALPLLFMVMLGSPR